MKKSQFVIIVLAASMLTAGLTSLVVTRGAKESGKISHEWTEYDAAPATFAGSGAGSHFTAYERENYPDLTYAAENAVQAVVNIQKTEELRRGNDPWADFWGIPKERSSGGSGVIISDDGYIATNNHVISNASTLRIKLYDGRTFDGNVVGTDPTTDIALVKIDAHGLPALAFGDSDKLRLGEWVLAIGSPFSLESTITAGIVSAKSRSLSIIPSEMSLEAFIQTDAAVNPGNSGGALVNTRGQLVGINTALVSQTGNFAGHSFAVPSTIVQKVCADLREYGVVQRAVLGVSFPAYNNPDTDEKYSVANQGGLYVMEVMEGGGAQEAGIKAGDVITAINGAKTNSYAVLVEHLAQHRPGDKVNLNIKREGKTKQISVVLRNKAGKAELLNPEYTETVKALGGTLAPVSEKTKREFKIDGGLVVQSVEKGGALSLIGIKRGFIITHINDKEVSTLDDLTISEKISSIEGIHPNGKQSKYILVKE